MTKAPSLLLLALLLLAATAHTPLDQSVLKSTGHPESQDPRTTRRQHPSATTQQNMDRNSHRPTWSPTQSNYHTSRASSKGLAMPLESNNQQQITSSDQKQRKCNHQKQDHLNYQQSSNTEARFLLNQDTRVLLEWNTTSSLQTALSTLQIIISSLRNLVLLGLLFNSMDVFLPYIVLMEGLLMCGFLPNQKYLLDEFFRAAFASKLDLLNAVRLLMGPEPAVGTPAVLAKMGFSGLLFLDVSGQLLLAALVLIFTVCCKIIASFFHSQRARKIVSRIRGIWNGLLMAVLPRCATFAMIYLSNPAFDSAGIVNLIVSALLALSTLVFLVVLLVKICRLTSEPKLAAERVRRVGLHFRIDYRETFEFDCLQFSQLYFPVLNYWRLLIYFYLLGLNYAYVYLSFGGPIIGQILILMMEISSTAYLRTRDRVLLPISNFLLIALIVSIIFVGIGEQVDEAKIKVASVATFVIVLAIIIVMQLVTLVLDVVVVVRDKCSQQEEEECSFEIEPETQNNKIEIVEETKLPPQKTRKFVMSKLI